MTHIPAKTGLQWIKEGYQTFKLQPFGFLMLFAAYFLIKQIVSFIPFGDFLSLIVFPIFIMAIAQSCIDVKEGKRIRLNLLFAQLRSKHLPSLLSLGVLYPVTIYVALGLSSLADGGTLWQLFLGSQAPDLETAAQGHIFLSLFIAALISIPSSMAFWYAAPLIMWQDMPLKKALFYSFFAVYKAIKAFIIYGILWGFIIMPVVSLIVSCIALFVNMELGRILALITSIILATIMYCSFFSTYKTMFGEKPEAV